MNVWQILNVYSILGFIILGMYMKELFVIRILPYLKELARARFKS
jgi:hypothetical protein